MACTILDLQRSVCCLTSTRDNFPGNFKKVKKKLSFSLLQVFILVKLDRFMLRMLPAIDVMPYYV